MIAQGAAVVLIAALGVSVVYERQHYFRSALFEGALLAVPVFCGLLWLSREVVDRIG